MTVTTGDARAQPSVAVGGVITGCNPAYRSAPSDESTAEIEVIEAATLDDKRHLGARILLRSADWRDRLYLDPGQVSQLRDEFADFEKWYERGKACEAIGELERTNGKGDDAE